MATCDTCGTTILFGGVKTDGFHFCGKKCASRIALLHSMRAVAQERIDAEADNVFNSTCPVCNGPGPVDLRFSHTITSLLYVTFWKSKPILACAKCGRKKQILGLVHCTFLGWWGIPWGIIRTPFMIGANIKALKAGKSTTPSDALKKHIRVKLAQQSPPVASATPYVRDPSAL